LLDKKAFFTITCGVYIVSSVKGGRPSGQIANSLFQVSSEPPTVAISINKLNLTHEFISESRCFAVSVLSREVPVAFIGRFGFKTGRDFDKFEGVNYRSGLTGAPLVLDHTISLIEAKVINQVDCGTHTIFIGEVVHCEKLNDNPPMTYDYYHLVKGGKAPKTAPSYIKEEELQKTGAGKYECEVCGYTYDPVVGDPENGIEPPAPFVGLPESWTCPVCGAGKESFKPL